MVFSLEYCDRKVMGFVANTASRSAEDVRDQITASEERRGGRVTRLPPTIEWVPDNGSC